MNSLTLNKIRYRCPQQSVPRAAVALNRTIENETQENEEQKQNEMQQIDDKRCTCAFCWHAFKHINDLQLTVGSGLEPSAHRSPTMFESMCEKWARSSVKIVSEITKFSLLRTPARNFPTTQASQKC